MATRAGALRESLEAVRRAREAVETERRAVIHDEGLSPADRDAVQHALILCHRRLVVVEDILKVTV